MEESINPKTQRTAYLKVPEYSEENKYSPNDPVDTVATLTFRNGNCVDTVS